MHNLPFKVTGHPKTMSALDEPARSIDDMCDPILRVVAQTTHCSKNAPQALRISVQATHCQKIRRRDYVFQLRLHAVKKCTAGATYFSPDYTLSKNAPQALRISVHATRCQKSAPQALRISAQATQLSKNAPQALRISAQACPCAESAGASLGSQCNNHKRPL
jgi:hypothetical protein